MAKLTDNPKVAEAIEKAEARGANSERKRINAILADVTAEAKEAEDRVVKKTINETVRGIKTRIREEA